MIKEGFEPSPLRTSALSWRLRPLGHLTFCNRYVLYYVLKGVNRHDNIEFNNDVLSENGQ